MRLVFLIILMLACARSSSDELGNDMGRAHAARAPIAADARFRTGMRHHDGDLRQIGHLLRAGRLADATTLAFWLTRPSDDPRLTGSPERARLSGLAREFAGATTLVEAVRLEARIAAVCGDCHARAGARVFQDAVVPPLDDGTTASRDRRHRWAAERVWNGVVGASELHWRAGLHVFAVDRSDPAVQAAASRAWEATDRARAYGDLLVTCMRCHP